MMRVIAVTIVIVVLGIFYMSDQISANQELVRKPVEKQEKEEEDGEKLAGAGGDDADTDDDKTTSARNGRWYIFVFLAMIFSPIRSI